ncbi:hypothetical protein B0T26DRAFT_811204 [Lasiosphaeria miniovina]|uniref:DUF5672 domain-containing protein n=1 Tax=Lasiosphaeria miniovina TaxID=1954250 RepID=A0AA40AUR9_9PEZI|nr:uncharacterized protein B0T26DRAFT_811204 [Lasiosphaeria miniovina]KAK0722402.1 hypothetical protein B0T26DRAFT_811204 [Lasiosphaeria miniovina]
MAAIKYSGNHNAVLRGDTDLYRLWHKSKLVALAAWGRTSRRIRFTGITLLFLTLTMWLLYGAAQTGTINLPSVSLEYHYERQATKFNESKVALLIENRPNPILAPLMLHFMSVVPPDWRFRFMGSVDSVAHMNNSVAIREQVAAGKLDLTYIPTNMTTGSQEEISRFLTTLWLYEVVLQPAEWLLVFQTDSILCANSQQTLNDYLDYDWVGAPWNPDGRFGGNGGLSLRRVSAIIDVLRNQERRDGTDPEDVWLTERLGHRPGAKLANGTTSSHFSGEMHSGEKANSTTPAVDPAIAAAQDGALVAGLDDWRSGFYEPMGYHTGGGGSTLHGAIWGTPALRKHIWDYCPEVKMTLHMDVARFVPGECGARWRRDLDSFTGDDGGGGGGGGGHGVETEVIDGVEYPVLPMLVPW